MLSVEFERIVPRVRPPVPHPATHESPWVRVELSYVVACRVSHTGSGEQRALHVAQRSLPWRFISHGRGGGWRQRDCDSSSYHFIAHRRHAAGINYGARWLSPRKLPQYILCDTSCDNCGGTFPGTFVCTHALSRTALPRKMRTNEQQWLSCLEHYPPETRTAHFPAQTV